MMSMNELQSDTSTSSTEETSDGTPSQDNPLRDPIVDMLNLKTAHQAMAMDHINMDRCLLRRDMKAKQNQVYDLSQESVETQDCEDDMGVQVGDNKTDNSKVVNNYYTNPDPPPDPQPCPPTNGKIPRWLIALLVLPWIALVLILIAWLINKWPDEPSVQPVIWQLRGAVEDPLAVPEPVTIQPTPQE